MSIPFLSFNHFEILFLLSPLPSNFIFIVFSIYRTPVSSLSPPPSNCISLVSFPSYRFLPPQSFWPLQFNDFLTKKKKKKKAQRRTAIWPRLSKTEWSVKISCYPFSRAILPLNSIFTFPPAPPLLLLCSQSYLSSLRSHLLPQKKEGRTNTRGDLV